MYIIIISDTASFPWGMASTTRVRNIAKGLMAEGAKVKYFGLRAADVESSSEKKREGEVDGICYSYPGGFAVRSGNWFYRRLDDFLGKWLSVRKILLLKLTGKLDAVVIYSRNSKIVLFWIRFFHLIKVPVILEICEWPLANVGSNRVCLKNAERFCRDAVLATDAALPISRYIHEQVQNVAQMAGRTIPLFTIPIMIDIDPTDINDSALTGEQYLLYSGSIAYMDIAQFVVDVSRELKNRGISIAIRFTGGGNSEAFENLKAYARKHEVLETLEFTGFLQEKHLWSMMRGAVALLAPLPDNCQSKARFPTKLGYYLASGRPVVTTSVGSVQEYLIDCTNAYIAEDYTPKSVADAIEKVLMNRDRANEIGKCGKKLAYEIFHYKNACKGIIEFIMSINN